MEVWFGLKPITWTKGLVRPIGSPPLLISTIHEIHTSLILGRLLIRSKKRKEQAGVNVGLALLIYRFIMYYLERDSQCPDH